MLFNVSFHLVFLFKTNRRKQQFQIFFADKCYHASWVYTFFASHISTPSSSWLGFLPLREASDESSFNPAPAIQTVWIYVIYPSSHPRSLLFN